MTRNTKTSPSSDAQIAARLLELCSQFQAMRREFEEHGDPLVLAERMKQIDMAAVDEAHAWLTKQIVDRYAVERITLDTGQFRMPVLKPIKA
jgi:hypothetical protein